ncbi:hypothetical protein EDB19DRAFT_1989395 [Suillus lakei]|nr:hypothetical protein EDB19DRAFT_1989395 [Suillus lakei]
MPPTSTMPSTFSSLLTSSTTPRLASSAPSYLRETYWWTNSINIMLDSEDYESYFSSDTLKEAEQTAPDAPEQTPDYLAMLSHPNTPPHRLDLKVNATIAEETRLPVDEVEHLIMKALIYTRSDGQHLDGQHHSSLSLATSAPPSPTLHPSVDGARSVAHRRTSWAKLDVGQDPLRLNISTTMEVGPSTFRSSPRPFTPDVNSFYSPGNAFFGNALAFSGNSIYNDLPYSAAQSGPFPASIMSTPV